ncbi:universal stress protein [Streptomyces sp. NPDC008086]|uniref:universal stress protein n=1 Tax=Streptomyces sp. NPDC008086 TaxID=3364807 RepID=UPI0036E2C2EE
MDLPIVVGVDGSESSLRAAEWAADEAVLRGVPLHLVYASLWECYQRAVFPTGRERSPGVSLCKRAVEGSARKVLLDASRDADLVVVGARRRPGHIGLHLGRVAHAVLLHSACPVAVVPERV